MTSTVKYLTIELNEHNDQLKDITHQEYLNRIVNESIKSQDIFNKQIKLLSNSLKSNNNNNSSKSSIDYIGTYNNNKLNKYLITSGLLIGVSYFVFKHC
jgi:hypothetical protein